MPGVTPKKKHSKGLTRRKRAHNSLRPLSTSACPQCRNAKLPHRLCPHCGYYNGREVLPVETVPQR